jgi:hypothetical protein
MKRSVAAFGTVANSRVLKKVLDSRVCATPAHDSSGLTMIQMMVWFFKFSRGRIKDSGILCPPVGDKIGSVKQHSRKPFKC